MGLSDGRKGARGGRNRGRGGKVKNGGKFENNKKASQPASPPPGRKRTSSQASKSTRQGSNPRHGDLPFPLIPPLYH